MLRRARFVSSSSGLVPRFLTTNYPSALFLPVARMQVRQQRQRTQRLLSRSSRSSQSASSETTISTKAGAPGSQQRTEYLKDANRQMQKYHEAKDLMKQGKLPSKNAHLRGNQASQMHYLAVCGCFLAAFLATPFIGKKIATDKDFRDKWVPSWYDFTVPEPEKPWTRQELHEQMLAVQKDLRERAIAGEFTPDKLEGMEQQLDSLNTLKPFRKELDRSKIPEGWDKVHPGLESDESLHEE